jgi:hypothetical protein
MPESVTAALEADVVTSEAAPVSNNNSNNSSSSGNDLRAAASPPSVEQVAEAIAALRNGAAQAGGVDCTTAP